MGYYSGTPTQPNTMGSFYYGKISEWKRIYKIDPLKTYNPTDYKICCTICESTKEIQRHHMACDFTFAVILPEVYAERYLKFLPEDIDWICRRCHEAYNKYSKKERNFVISWSNWALVYVKKGYREQLEERRLYMLNLYLKWKERRIKWYKARKK